VLFRSQKFWELLCEKIEHKELKDDKRFITNDLRMKNRDELTVVLDEIFSQKPADDWMKILGGTVPSAPVADIRQAMENPYLMNAGKTLSVPYEKSSHRQEVKFIAPPFSFDGRKFTDFKVGPAIGEHTVEILKSLDYEDREIDCLLQKKVIMGKE